MKKVLMAGTIAALLITGFMPAAQATGYTSSGQQSGSEHCSGDEAALDTGAAVGVVEAGESDWYSVTSDEPVVLRWRPASAQFGTGISDIRVYDWDSEENTCRAGAYEANTIFGSEPMPILGCCFLQGHIELGPFPPGQYQVKVHAWNSQVPAQAYVLTSTPA